MIKLQSTNVKAIVVGTDLSPAADIAVEQAAILAKFWQADLWLLHVFNDSLWASIKGVYDAERWAGKEPALSARSRLSQQVREVADRHGIAAYGETRTGRAAAEIARFMGECDAQLLVVGEHGEDWIADTVIGGTALKVIEQAGVPVLLARRPVGTDISSVLVATDFSENAARAVHLALSWFPSAMHYLLHAYLVAFEGRMRLAGASDEDIERYRDAEKARAETQMHALRESLPADADTAIRTLYFRGHPLSAVFEESSRRQHDLIVIGKHGGSIVEERLLGSVTQNILYHATCNVLVVP